VSCACCYDEIDITDADDDDDDDAGQFEIVGGSRRWGSRCAYDFYSTRSGVEGRFFSPGFPQRYPPDTRCQYAFFGKPSERVKITFHNFSLEQIDGRQESLASLHLLPSPRRLRLRRR